MKECGILQRVSCRRRRSLLAFLPEAEDRKGALLFSYPFCLLVVLVLLSGCSGLRAKSSLTEAHDLSEKGNYNASLNKYEEIIQRYPEKTDRVLFEMGILYSHPRNGKQDLQKSIECFQKLLKDYPGSGYRQDSQMMVFYISAVAVKDQKIAAQKATVDTLKNELQSKEKEIAALQEHIKTLEQKVFVLATQKGSVDKIVIEKRGRQLTLLSKGEVLKTYRIALGGNPEGPKERQGDNKTPEGTYVIDSRNTDSRYHLSLHISYPNERDKRRAKELGVSPGGNIMIHGIKNGFSWVGDTHTQVDWTQGCIAVTDEEIDEIARVVPNGTTVEIRP